MVMDKGGEREPDGGGKTSEAMRSVVEALIEGKTAPPEAQAALTDAERAEVAALARTAHLTRLTMHKPDPSPTVEAAALSRAQQTLAARAPITEPNLGGGNSFWRSLWARLSGASTNGDEEER